MSVRKELAAFVAAAVRCDDLEDVRERAATIADLICNGDEPVSLVVPADDVRAFCATIAALGQGR